MASGDPFFFAELWDVWHDGEPDAIASFTILTTDPNELAATVHNRMLVIVLAKAYERWLDPGIKDNNTKIADILGSYPGQMITCPISKRVNEGVTRVRKLTLRAGQTLAGYYRDMHSCLEQMREGKELPSGLAYYRVRR